MVGSSFPHRHRVLLLAIALSAAALRLPSPPEPEAAEPWIRGTLLLQALGQPGEAGQAHGDLLVALPLGVAQNVGYLAARISGGEGVGDRGAWIRSHGGLSRSVLWGIWIAGAVAASLLATRAVASPWGYVAGLLVAVAPIGLAGTRRLDGWALAAAIALLALPRPVGGSKREDGWELLPLTRTLAWGALVSLTPLGWVLALLVLLFGGRESRLPVLLAIPLWFALEPIRLIDPVGAISRLRSAFLLTGWPGVADGPPGRLLIAQWTPGVMVLLFALLGAARAVRSQSIPAAAGFLLLWLLPGALGARRPDSIGLIAPVSIVLAACGAQDLFVRAARARAVVAAALALLLVGSVALGARAEIRGDAERRQRARRVVEAVAREMKGAGLLLRDPSAPAVPESIASFSLPTHVERPEVWDFAYWPGWYGGFTHLLVRARTLEAIAEDRDHRPAGLALLAALAKHADPILSLGNPATDRSALVLFRLHPGSPWGAEAVRDPWAGSKGGNAEARFLSDLAGFLAQHGKPDRAIEILRLALTWDDSDPRIWNNLGSTLLLMGEAKEAAATFDQGLRRDPSSLELRYNLAKAYLAGNVAGRAVIELRKVLQRSPGFAPAHYDLARAAAAEEDWPLAVQALESYLSANPNPPNRAQVETALAEARRRVDRKRVTRAGVAPGEVEVPR